MAYMKIHQSIGINDEEWLRVTKNFAEKNLSNLCLKLADYKNSKYYEWELENSGQAVMFELPQIFQKSFYQMINELSIGCPEYLVELKLSTQEVANLYIENSKKELK